jgi:hypothetical protein
MITSILKRNGAIRLVVLAAVGVAAACSSGDGSGDSATAKPAAATATRPCVTPVDSILGLAAIQFTKHVTPKPHRYLIPAGTDSALPERAYWGLQTTGATLNVFPRDTALQKKAKDQLSGKGKLTLLLVNYHGQRKLPDGRVALDFSGHYMGGDVDGKAVPRTAILFSCHATGERFVVEGPPAATPAPTP